MACNRITAAITSRYGERSVKALLGSYTPTGSTRNVNFTTSRTCLWTTDPRKSHVNFVVLDSDWEAEFCRVVESQPSVMAYVKNHNLGLEVPYLYGSIPRRYIPDFILLVDDGNEDPLHLVVEIKGYRGEDAKEKKNTMEAYWLPGVNALGDYGRWAFAEFTDVFDIEPNLRRVNDSHQRDQGVGAPDYSGLSFKELLAVAPLEGIGLEGPWNSLTTLRFDVPDRHPCHIGNSQRKPLRCQCVGLVRRSNRRRHLPQRFGARGDSPRRRTNQGPRSGTMRHSGKLAPRSDHPVCPQGSCCIRRL